MMKYLTIPMALAWLILAGTAANADPTGVWRVADGNATVRIQKCGRAFCGYVASTRSPPGADVMNPDPAKRRRSVLGIQVLSNLRPTGTDVWSGTSYNAEDGQTYMTQVTMQGPGTLQIKGCVPNGGLCGSETWTRIK
jgi:uncharacterized protein (DUF2147 family)